MNSVAIPNFADLQLHHLVLDYNGTIAMDGMLKHEVAAMLGDLCEQYAVHVITADTFGSVLGQLRPYNVSVKVLQSSDHTAEKAAYIEELGASGCIAVGNGNNDAMMLKNAALGIAILGDEGCATPTLLASDITCKAISEALELCLLQKRLIATLRR